MECVAAHNPGMTNTSMHPFFLLFVNVASVSSAVLCHLVSVPLFIYVLFGYLHLHYRKLVGKGDKV